MATMLRICLAMAAVLYLLESIQQAGGLTSTSSYLSINCVRTNGPTLCPYYSDGHKSCTFSHNFFVAHLGEGGQFWNWSIL